MTPEALRRKPEGLYERRKMKMEREHTKVLDFEAVRAIAAETPDSELIRWVDEALREKSGYTLPPQNPHLPAGWRLLQRHALHL